jgi:acetyltransferase-like isoleucine patch superfamily enzyme
MVKRILKRILKFPLSLVLKLDYFKFIHETKDNDAPITFQIWFWQKVVGFNKGVYWPMHHGSIASYSNRVEIGIETNPGMNPGCYIHGVNRIYIGDYTQFGPNVGLMSGNHDLYDFRNQQSAKPIKIGKHCWIGMGAVILPEVELGDFTIVGAGSIVTKSFPEGKCVIVGNPARKVKDLDADKCIYFTTSNPYIGFKSSSEFEYFKKTKLDI